MSIALSYHAWFVGHQTESAPISGFSETGSQLVDPFQCSDDSVILLDLGSGSSDLMFFILPP